MKHIIITLLALSSSFNISPYIPRKTHIFSSPATSSTASPLPKHDGSLTPDCEYSSILSTDRNKNPPLSSQEYPSVGQLKSVIPKSCFEVRENVHFPSSAKIQRFHLTKPFSGLLGRHIDVPEVPWCKHGIEFSLCRRWICRFANRRDLSRECTILDRLRCGFRDC